MSDCLWNDIDAYLAAALLEDMGPDSDYATLQIEEANIVVGESFDPDHIGLPFVMVRGLETTFEVEGPHGDGDVHYDAMTYPYQFIFAAMADTVSETKADIQELARRGRELLRGRVGLGGLTADDGETVVRVDVKGMRVELRGIGGTNQGKYVGFGVVEFDVITEI